MAKGDHTFRRRGNGARGGGYARPRFQVGFDTAQISIITRLAQVSDRSFAAEVRALVNAALKARAPLLAAPSPEEQAYLDNIAASGNYDPAAIVGGPARSHGQTGDGKNGEA